VTITHPEPGVTLVGGTVADKAAVERALFPDVQPSPVKRLKDMPMASSGVSTSSATAACSCVGWGCGTNTKTGSGSVPALGNKVTSYSKFTSAITADCWKALLTMNGETRGSWLGTNPTNAERGELTSRIKISALGFEITNPAGFTVVGGGDEATYTGAWGAEVGWMMQRKYSNFQASGQLTGIQQRDSATMRLRGVDYTAYSTASL
jgi:hypothetical protein